MVQEVSEEARTLKRQNKKKCDVAELSLQDHFDAGNL